MKGKRVLWGLLVVIAAVAVIGYLRTQKRDNDKLPVEVETFQTPNGWGYNLVVDHKTFIHQETIPGKSGREGFKSREEALRVGNTAMEKLKKGKIPAITPHDLDSLNIH